MVPSPVSGLELQVQEQCEELPRSGTHQQAAPPGPRHAGHIKSKKLNSQIIFTRVHLSLVQATNKDIHVFTTVGEICQVQ